MVMIAMRRVPRVGMHGRMPVRPNRQRTECEHQQRQRGGQPPEGAGHRAALFLIATHDAHELQLIHPETDCKHYCIRFAIDWTRQRAGQGVNRGILSLAFPVGGWPTGCSG
jgi:hypothetical protein